MILFGSALVAIGPRIVVEEMALRASSVSPVVSSTREAQSTDNRQRAKRRLPRRARGCFVLKRNHHQRLVILGRTVPRELPDGVEQRLLDVFRVHVPAAENRFLEALKAIRIAVVV